MGGAEANLAVASLPAAASHDASDDPNHRARAWPAWYTLLASGAIIAAAIAAYWNSLDGEFMFDDRVWIVENSSIKHLWPLGDVLLPADAAHVGGRPIVSLSLALNYALGGLDVRGYHVVNLAIHICAALVLFGVIRRTLMLPRLANRFGSSATALAAIVALIWAVHPIQTEAVSYVIQRAESLVGLFYLLTLYCFIRGATTTSRQAIADPLAGPRDAALRSVLNDPSPTPHPSPLTSIWYCACFASCLLGMATKEVMVSAPLVLFLYDRTFVSGSFREALALRWRLYLALAGTWLVLAWVLLATSFHADTTGLGVERFTPWTYLMTEPAVLLNYLRLSVWPDRLCFAYDLMPPYSFAQVVAPGLAIFALLGLTIWALVKWPCWGFLGAAFFLILAPTSSVVPILDAAFEHRMYLPLAALTSLVVIAGFALVERNSSHSIRARLVLTCLAATVVVALTGATVIRNRAYQSEYAIWQDTVEKRPGNPRAHYSVARALSRQGKTAEAISEYKATLALEPNYAEAYQNWGSELAGQGKLDEAIALFENAIRVRPNYAQGHFNLALALARRGELDAAIRHYTDAIRIEPHYAEAHMSLGRLLGLRGAYTAAAAELERAVELEPDDARAQCYLASLLVQTGELDEAATHCRRALLIDPQSVDAETCLASVLMFRGNVAEAAVHAQRAVEIAPQSAEAQTKLAAVLRLQGNSEAATARYRRAIAIDPNCAEAHFNLGVILDGQGNLPDAIDQWREAVRLRPNDPEALNDLAWALATASDDAWRDGVTALELAQRAARLTNGKEPAILATLAAAQAETGQYAKAVETAERALELVAPGPLTDRLRAQIQAEIERFSAGFAFRAGSTR